MRLGELFQATVGRRLSTRIWMYGVLLFCANLAVSLIARFVLPQKGGVYLPGRFNLHVVMLVLTALLIAWVTIALPLSRSIARPLRKLGGFARELGDGNLAVRAPAERRDEIGDLARSFNRMAEQIQRLRNAERELLADVSHELRTPLARMRVVLDLAADGDPEELRRYLREVATDLSELEQLVDDIIVGARLEADPGRWSAAEPPLRRRSTTVEELVEATAARFRSRWPERELVCRLPDERIAVDVDPVLVRRALDNLLDNARKYSPDDRPIVLSVERGDGGAVRIAVVDRGVGIAPEDQPRVFTPFFRADPSRSRATGGVGLGLVLARRIVESHGGSIGFTSAREAGSTFWLTLPA